MTPRDFFRALYGSGWRESARDDLECSLTSILEIANMEWTDMPRCLVIRLNALADRRVRAVIDAEHYAASVRPIGHWKTI